MDMSPKMFRTAQEKGQELPFLMNHLLLGSRCGAMVRVLFQPRVVKCTHTSGTSGLVRGSFSAVLNDWSVSCFTEFMTSSKRLKLTCTTGQGGETRTGLGLCPHWKCLKEYKVRYMKQPLSNTTSGSSQP